MLFSVLISFALQLLYTLGFAISDNLGLLLALPAMLFALGDSHLLINGQCQTLT